MNLHEYQAKAVLSRFGLPVLPGVLCYTAGEVEAAADRMLAGKASNRVVLKAQVHAGGRGKAGGVKIANSAMEARSLAETMLGMRITNEQTGKEGRLVRKLYVEPACDISRQLYVALLIDRNLKAISIVVCPDGGVAIEETAARTPERVLNVPLLYRPSLAEFQAREVCNHLLPDDPTLHTELSKVLRAAYDAFLACDFSLLEINPLVFTSDNECLLLDAKVSVDDNALYRHPHLAALNDYDELDPRDIAAAKVGVSYVGLDGTIGCMVNGAGLAMATMDIIKLHGGSPANFLDVGGGATGAMVGEAFRILTLDKKVKAILVNIFGGIMRCDVVAGGIVEAAKNMHLKVPLVVRLEGTNVEEGKKILAGAGLSIVPADSLDAAAKLAVKFSQGGAA